MWLKKKIFFDSPHREKPTHFFSLLATNMEQFPSSILELIKFQIQSQKELQERQIKNEEKFQQQILELKQDNDKKQLEISELIHKAILTKENKSDKKFC